MSKPIHTYLDLDVVNNNLISDSIAPALRFEETRTTPFLEGDTSEYFAAIIRFSIQTGNSLPIFIPRIQTGQDDVDLTVYKVTLSVFASDGHLYESTTTVRHVTSDHTADQPRTPFIQQDLAGTYYYQYNVSDIVSMFNTALNTAWINLLASLFLASPTELWPSVKNAYVPFFEFDSDKYRLVLNIDQSFVDGNTPNGKFDGLLYFNTRFFELVSGLACDRVSRVGDGNYLFTPDPKSTRSLKDEGGTTHTLYSTVQEMSSMAIWNPIASIVFCTGMLPIVSTNTSPPLTYGDTTNNNLTSNGNNSNLTNIISDFEIPVSETNQYRPVIVYNPSTEYRLIDMHSALNLNRIDISVFWKTHFGEYIPLRLQPGCAAHIKLMFRHKTFYLGY